MLLSFCSLPLLQELAAAGWHVASVPYELLQPFATRLDALQPAELPPISLPDPAAVAAAESAAARAEVALVMRDRCGPCSSGLCASVSCGLLGHTVNAGRLSPTNWGAPSAPCFTCVVIQHHIIAGAAGTPHVAACCCWIRSTLMQGSQQLSASSLRRFFRTCWPHLGTAGMQCVC